MKKLYYEKEKTKYYNFASIILFSFFIVFVYGIRHDKVDSMILLPFMVIFVNLHDCSEGIMILYKKRACKTKGTQYDGIIIGKIERTVHKRGYIGYYYQLVVLYDHRKVKTPYMKIDFISKIKSRKCNVYEYHNMTYVDGFEVCEKGEKAIDIREMTEDQLCGLPMFSAVRVTSDRYRAEGVEKGAVGYIIEIYGDACEVEFSRPDGTTYALQAIPCKYLKPMESGGEHHDT